MWTLPKSAAARGVNEYSNPAARVPAWLQECRADVLGAGKGKRRRGRRRLALAGWGRRREE
eukprot:scaffold4064_cov117-Isochrysis_galbana.AAC.1